MNRGRWSYIVRLTALLATSGSATCLAGPAEDAAASASGLIDRVNEAMTSIRATSDQLNPGELGFREFGSLVLVGLGASRAGQVFDGEVRGKAEALLAECLRQIEPQLLLGSDLWLKQVATHPTYVSGFTLHLLSELVETRHETTPECTRCIAEIVGWVTSKPMINNSGWGYAFDNPPIDTSASAAVAVGLASARPHVDAALRSKIDASLGAIFEVATRPEYAHLQYSEERRQASKWLSIVGAHDRAVRNGLPAVDLSEARGRIAGYVSDQQCLDPGKECAQCPEAAWARYRAYYFSLIDQTGTSTVSTAGSVAPNPYAKITESAQGWTFNGVDPHGGGAGNLFDAGFILFALAETAGRVWLTPDGAGGLRAVCTAPAPPSIWCAPAFDPSSPPQRREVAAPAMLLRSSTTVAGAGAETELSAAEVFRGWPEAVTGVWVWAEDQALGDHQVCSNMVYVARPAISVE